MKRLTISPFVVYVRQQFFWLILISCFVGLSTYTTSHAQTRAISNTNENLTAVVYGGGQWLVAGNNGTILTSPDGITWTTCSSGTTAKLTAISYGGGQWIVIGDNGTILTSPDGITWTARNSGTTAYLSDISYGAGQWIIVSDIGTLTSPDGINWTARGTPGVSISYGGGKWGLVYGNQFLTSTDGITWTLSNLDRSFYDYTKVRYSGGRWIVFYQYGKYTTIISSSDEVNWVYYTFSQPVSGGRIYSVAFGNGLWVGVGANQAIVTSSDGINWSIPRTPQFSYPPLADVDYGDGRWVMVGSGGTILYTNNALPVSLVAFQGAGVGTTAHLTWETAWEKGASHFLVERSRDAKSFEAIGRLEAQGTTDKTQQYNFLDKELSSGIWYYRLRQVDLDGTFTYSQIIAIRIGTESLNELTLSPNPSSGLLVVEHKAGIRSISIYSAMGGLVHQQLFDKVVDRWTWEGAGQPAGAYLIRVQNQDGSARTLRWMKK